MSNKNKSVRRVFKEGWKSHVFLAVTEAYIIEETIEIFMQIHLVYGVCACVSMCGRVGH
jgi:hypothetical protein